MKNMHVYLLANKNRKYIFFDGKIREFIKKNENTLNLYKNYKIK